MIPSIRLVSIGKRYRIGGRGASYRTLRESLAGVLAAPLRALRSGADRPAAARHIWALKEVSLEIQPGEVIGVIGRNGAGKSTLLKLLARITPPTTGQAELRGRVGSLLDVGTGFHSELTGRENILLNGAILGMRSGEVRRKLEQIVDFSGVEEFIDTPLKHYSDGMRVRLAFAISAHLEVEILLADEVLAVGDVAFQKKCFDAMGSLARGGRTVLFVSHNLSAVGDLCSRTILLERGGLADFGRSHEVIRRYLAEFSPTTPETIVDPPAVDQGVAIRRILLADETGVPATELDWRLPISVGVEFAVTQRLPALSIGVTLVNQLGVRAVHSWAVFQEPFDPGLYLARGNFPGEMLSPGRYYVHLGAERYGVELLHTPHQAAAFEIVKTSGEFGYDLESYALLYARIPWQVRPVSL